MIDIVARVDEWRLRSRRSWVAKANSASILGWPCERRLVYERTETRKELPDLTLSSIFADGNMHEEAVMTDLRAAGFKIVEQQRGFEDRAHQIRGHVDAFVPADGVLAPIEVKSMSARAWDKIGSVDDMLRSREPYHQGYPAQLTMYLYLPDDLRASEGAFLLKNKATGRLKQVNMALDYAYAEELIQKADRVNAHVESGTLPDPVNDEHVCRQCPFRAICPTDASFGPPLQMADDPEVIAMLERREELSWAHKEYEEVDKRVKEALKGEPNLLIGRFHVSGKEVERRGYEVQPTTYWQTKIVPVEGPAVVTEAA